MARQSVEIDWYIRKMEQLDLENYLRFLGQWITHVPVSSHYQWLQENPHGKPLIWLVIHRKTNDIIGCHSIFPRKLWVRNKYILGGIGGDMFVEPRFRRRGIATELQRACLMEMKEAGIQVKYGFPLGPNLRAILKAGGYHIGIFKKMEFGLFGMRVVNKLCRKGAFSFVPLRLTNKILYFYTMYKLSRFYNSSSGLRQIYKFGTEFDKLVEDLFPSYGICVVRDSEYLNWRYFKNPLRPHVILGYEANGVLCGFACLEFSKYECYLVDFFVKNDDELVESFVCAIVKFAVSKGSNLILSIINPVGLYARNFRNCGFRLGLDLVDGFPLDIMVPRSENDSAYLMDIRNWHLTYMDIDIESVPP